MADVGSIDTSSYPKFGQGNKLMGPGDQMQQMGNVVSIVQGLQQLSQSQFDLAHKQLGALNGIIGPVAALPDPTIDDVRRGVQQAVNMGVLPAQHAAQAITEASQAAQQPGGIKRLLFDHLSSGRR